METDLTEILVQALRKSVKTSLWILRIMIPVSLAVKILWFLGIIDIMAGWLQPLMHLIGLPGHSAIVVLSGALVGTHAGLAALISLPFTLREATIISIMICLCHAVIVEGAVVKKIGPPFAATTLIRISAAIIAAWTLSHILPAMPERFAIGISSMEARPAHITLHSFGNVMADAGISLLKLSALMFSVMFLLITIKDILTKKGLMDSLVRPFKPLMMIFGLSSQSAYLWLVGYIVGISYGAGVLKDLVDENKMSKEDAKTVSYHLIISHSIIEDTLVFAAFGVPALWIIGTRVTMATALVWSRKLVKAGFKLKWI
ncbi:MAG: hypothetical protein HUK08_03680 [Bacteroidaceae bacterium]|nr:hypothetical protein [Bacteroidaceae bacterium]